MIARLRQELSDLQAAVSNLKLENYELRISHSQSLVSLTGLYLSSSILPLGRGTFALNGVPAARSTVQEHIDQVVVQQVDLVHVQDATVGLGLHGSQGRVAVSAHIMAMVAGIRTGQSTLRYSAIRPRLRWPDA